MWEDIYIYINGKNYTCSENVPKFGIGQVYDSWYAKDTAHYRWFERLSHSKTCYYSFL